MAVLGEHLRFRWPWSIVSLCAMGRESSMAVARCKRRPGTGDRWQLSRLFYEQRPRSLFLGEIVPLLKPNAQEPAVLATKHAQRVRNRSRANYPRLLATNFLRREAALVPGRVLRHVPRELLHVSQRFTVACTAVCTFVSTLHSGNTPASIDAVCDSAFQGEFRFPLF